RSGDWSGGSWDALLCEAPVQQPAHVSEPDLPCRLIKHHPHDEVAASDRSEGLAVARIAGEAGLDANGAGVGRVAAGQDINAGVQLIRLVRCGLGNGMGDSRGDLYERRVGHGDGGEDGEVTGSGVVL